MDFYSTYRLSKGVQVRRERFGLLFYDYRGPRLYFLPTKTLVKEDFFDGNRPLTNLVNDILLHHHWPRSLVEERLCQIMNQLEAKGLIHGQSLC